MKKDSMYKNLAKYYDFIYQGKDYQKEINYILELVSKYKKSTGNYLIDVGCGTGNHLKFLTDKFNCTGLDINEEMLKIAQSKLEKCEFVKGNMVNFSLQMKFDIILSLFSSIGYVKTENNLKRTLANLSHHLNEGGLIIIEPWLTKENFRTGSPHMSTYDSENLKIARLNISESRGNVSFFDMHFLIAEKNKPVKHYIDHHELGLFPIKLIIDIMEKNNLNTIYKKEEPFNDRGLIIGVKQ